MKSLIRYTILAAAFIVLLAVSSGYSQDNSHARAVRLSFVEGEVTVQRPDVQEWAKAPVNTPLQEGFTLATGENSFAEIQFENGGAVRLGQLSALQFTQLGLAADGGKINRLELRQGYATFHPLPSRVEESLQVSTPYGRVNAAGGAQFRVDLDQGAERVEVFEGAVEAESNLGKMTVEKDTVLVMQSGTSDPTVVSQGISKDDWDQWVDDREAQVGAPPSGPSPENYGDDATQVTYGWNDLSQYGTWSNVQGVGYGWSPNGIASGWAPYSTGQWCWYPGWGYTWIGAEPWGWLPYHYGGWNFIPGRGWVWFPSNFATWSPSLVTWYHGPNWIGWRPRPHHRDDSLNCEHHCGGGVVSTSTFRQGGLLTSNLMLGFSPTVGERVKDPGITPAASAFLPGPAVARPPMQGPGRRGNPSVAPFGDSRSTAGPLPPRVRRPGAANPDSTIVYDPEQNRYINSHRPTRAQESTGPATAASGFHTPTNNPAMIQPVPVTGRDSSGRAVESNPYNQPNPEIGTRPTRPVPVVPRTGGAPQGYPYAAPANPSTAKPAPSAPTGNAYGGRPSGNVGTPSGSHTGGGSSSGSSFNPGGGGHAGGSGGGGHAGAPPSGGAGGGHH